MLQNILTDTPHVCVKTEIQRLGIQVSIRVDSKKRRQINQIPLVTVLGSYFLAPWSYNVFFLNKLTMFFYPKRFERILSTNL